MMKKNGFTLAEVLITLSIIGVVATMTLPSLMTNTAEQQAKSAMKKAVNTFTEAAQMAQTIDGYDYASLISTDTDEEAQSLYGLLVRHTAVDLGKSGTGKQTSTDSRMSNNYTIFFRDGSSLSFKPAAASNGAAANTGGAQDADKMMEDNLPYGIPVVYDINGAKGPNMISNCDTKTTGLSGTEKDVQAADAKAACTKDKRVIKDQFGLRLRGGFAVPNGAAARYVFEN